MILTVLALPQATPSTKSMLFCALHCSGDAVPSIVSELWFSFFYDPKVAPRESVALSSLISQ